MDVTWGVTGCIVPSRGTNMENTINKTAMDGETMTTGNDNGQKLDSDRKERESFNPFARASRIGRSPPPKGPRPRVDSCPNIKLSLSNLRGQEDRDKRKRPEASSPPTSTMAAAMATEKECRTEGGDEVFVVEGSPEASRETKKKRKEQGSSYLNRTWEECEEPAEVTAMSNGLRQMAQKLEKLAGDLCYETKKQVNTKVEIKKMARELDIMSQNLSRKVNKFCTVVGRKLRKSSDREDAPDSEASRGTRATKRDAASQTDIPPRKLQKEGVKKVTEAVTDEEIIGAANKKWLEGWFQATTVKVGNPWNSSAEDDLAIMITDGEAAMETGIGRLLKDRFPEVGKIEGSGSLKVSNTVQIGAEDPVTKNRAVHKVTLAGPSDTEILEAIKSLSKMVPLGSKAVSVPVPSGLDENKFRKLVELVFRKRETRVAVHIPQRRGGTPKTPGTRETGIKPRRNKDTEVLLIKQGGKSYTDMVKGLRAMVGNQEVGSLKQIRKTQDGRLLLAFKKGEPEAEELKAKIKNTWEDAVVTGGGGGDTRKCTFHLKNLDAAVEDDEIWEALREAAPTLQRHEVEIGERRPMFGGNLAVSIRAENRLADQLRGRNRMKIGFNMCRMEERVEVHKCYRCWEFGHIARQCRGPDRRSLCSGCGKEGHVVASCSNALYCVLCDLEGHRGGSGSCPRFREALRAAKRVVQEKPTPPSEDRGDERPPNDN